MARGNGRRMRVVNNNHTSAASGAAATKKNDTATTLPVVRTTSSILAELEGHWESMPSQLCPFLLHKKHTLTLHDLAKFWSGDSMVAFTRGGIAGSVCGSSWFMASMYLRIGMANEARVLTLNGSFLHECYVSVFEQLNLGFFYQALVCLSSSRLCFLFHINIMCSIHPLKG